MVHNRYIGALERHFAQTPDRLFCKLVSREGETVLTWADLQRGCRSFAAAYAAAGLARGDVVLIFLRHVPQLYSAFFGAMLGGFIPSFMPCTSPRQDPRIYWSSHAELLAKIRPAAIVADRATFAEMDAAGLDRGAARALIVEDIAEARGTFASSPESAIGLLQHSSGTTGLKKGVALSFAAIVEQIESYSRSLRLAGDDVIVSWLPLYHDMGLIACCIMPAYFGIPIVHIDPFHWLAQPDLLLRHLDNDRGTLTWLPNFAFEHLAAICGRRAKDFDLSRVRAFIDCSEPCKPRTFDRFATAFAPSGVHAGQLHCCYAMAETVFAVSQTEIDAIPHRIRVDAASLDRGRRPRLMAAQEPGVDLVETGTPIDGIAVAVYDEEHRPLPAGTVGEIALSGRFLFSGYNREPERTAERLRAGSYFSRDLGFVHDGRVYVLGRTDDLIIINGRNLYAHEIEAAVSQVDGLKPGRSVAVPQFDERIGSEALVVISEKTRGSQRSTADIQRDVINQILSTFNIVPRKVHIVDEGWLVKTTSGKISRKENLAKITATAEAQAHAG